MNADCDAAFHNVKHALCDAPVLAMPDLRSTAIYVEQAWELCSYKGGDQWPWTANAYLS